MENVICPPTSEQPHLLPEQAICLLTGAEDEVAGTVAAEIAEIAGAEIAETIVVEIAETEEEGTEARANSATHT